MVEPIYLLTRGQLLRLGEFRSGAQLDFWLSDAGIDAALGDQRYTRAEVEAALRDAIERAHDCGDCPHERIPELTESDTHDALARLDSARAGTQEGE